MEDRIGNERVFVEILNHAHCKRSCVISACYTLCRTVVNICEWNDSTEENRKSRERTITSRTEASGRSGLSGLRWMMQTSLLQHWTFLSMNIQMKTRTTSSSVLASHIDPYIEICLLINSKFISNLNRTREVLQTRTSSSRFGYIPPQNSTSLERM